MIFLGGRGETVRKIGETDVVHEVKCLRIIVNDKTKCFKRHKVEKIKLARQNGKYDLLSYA